MYLPTTVQNQEGMYKWINFNDTQAKYDKNNIINVVTTLFPISSYGYFICTIP